MAYNQPFSYTNLSNVPLWVKEIAISNPELLDNVSKGFNPEQMINIKKIAIKNGYDKTQHSGYYITHLFKDILIKNKIGY